MLKIVARRRTALPVIAALALATTGTTAQASGRSAPAATVRSSSSTGLAFAVDSGRTVRLPRRCGVVHTGTGAALVQLLVTVTGGRTATRVSIGGTSWTAPRRQTTTHAIWARASRGGVAACLHGRRASAQVLAHTVGVTAQRPGGRAEVTARIPLPTSGTTAGRWNLPGGVVPARTAGLILQAWSANAGAVRLHAGRETVTLRVGSKASAATVVVRTGALSWRRSSGRGAVHAVLLGYVTSLTDKVQGGARLHLLAVRPRHSGAGIRLAGRDHVPSAGARTPPTSVLTNLTGSAPAVADPLAAGRRVTSGAVRGDPTSTLLRLDRRGAVHFDRSASLSVIGYLSGDVVRRPTAVDLTQSGSPQLAKAPAGGVLTFTGNRPWRAGYALVFGAGKYTPGGLIAVVTHVRHTATSTLLSYRVGGLTDAFNVLDLTTQVPLRPKAKSGKERTPQDITPIDGSHSLHFGGSRSFTLGSSPQVSGAISFSFDPAVSLKIVITQGVLGIPNGFRIHYALDTNTTLTASVTASAGWSGSTSVPLPQLTLGAFPLGPLTVVPELRPSLTFGASVQGSVSFTETVTHHAHVGFTSELGRGSYPDGNNGYGHPAHSGTTQLSLSASVSATLSLEFVLAIDGVAGPFASASITASAELSTGGWHVHVGGSFGIGIDLNLLDIEWVRKALDILNIPTRPTWQIWQLNWDWKGANGSSGGSGSGSTAGGGSGSGAQPVTLSPGTGRINISPCLNLRSGPGGGTALVGCIPSGELITIECTAGGNSVTGPYGATTIWDRTTYGGASGYVSDAYVYTGTNGAAAGACQPGGGSPPPPVSGNGNGRINIDPCLNLRAGPNGSTALVGCIPKDTVIAIDCTAQGNSVTGPYGATTLWDHTTWNGTAGYVSDAYVYTGTANAVAGPCGGSPPPPPPPPAATGRIIIQPCLNLRAGPNGSTTLLDCVPYDTVITIECTSQGNAVTGPYGTTTLWDRTVWNGKRGFVSDAYVYTGTANAVAGPC